MLKQLQNNKLLILLAAFLAPALSSEAARTTQGINDEWRFHFGEQPDAESRALNDSTWQVIKVPHTWNALDGQDGTKGKMTLGTGMRGDYARGTGWYRRLLRPSADWTARQVFIQFDGANKLTEVYVNGRLVGTHLGGYARFRFNITSALRPDAENLIAVKVNNEIHEAAPISGDFTFFGGLYRNVDLITADPLHIELLDYGAPGVYLTQKSVTEARAEISAKVKLANDGQAPLTAIARIRILDANGAAIREVTSPVSLAAGARGEIELPLVIDAPHLWNGRQDPYLYRACVELLRDGEVCDSVEEPLGLRYFKVDPQQGFFLNGKHVDLHGVSRHQDRINKGWALAPEDEREDMGLIAEMGCTAVRVAHYQQSPLWYRLADEQGMVLWSEVPFVNEALPSAHFLNNLMDQAREMIRQNYNHPSIMFWGVGNETFDSDSNPVEGMNINGPAQERTIQALNALAKAEDPSRLSTYASFHCETAIKFPAMGKKSFSTVTEPQRWYTDTTAFNKYFGWYYGEPEDFAEFFDSMHAKHPTQPIGVSEYGAGGCISQHDATNYGAPDAQRIPMTSFRMISVAKKHPEEFQANYHERSWKVFAARPYLWTKFIWNMFDFASDARDEGDQPGRNDKGLVTFDRKTRKDAFYFYKANWSTDPVLHLSSSRFTQRTSPDVIVKAYSNADQVELYVNGEPHGKATGDTCVFTWPNIKLKPGRNEVRVDAIIGGKQQSDSCVWTLPEAANK